MNVGAVVGSKTEVKGRRHTKRLVRVVQDVRGCVEPCQEVADVNTHGLQGAEVC